MIKNSERYKQYFNENYLMGPNSVRLLDELLIIYPLHLQKGDQVLDLGCGLGLTSYFIAKEIGATVSANDLWIKAEENKKRFIEWKVDDQIIPRCEDANALSYPPGTFDAIISINSYHYFAREKGFFQTKIMPLVKKGGLVLIGIPGMKEEYEGHQKELLDVWLKDEAEMFHSFRWWKELIGKDNAIQSVDTWELSNFDIAWDEWLATSNPFAKEDKIYYESVIKKYTAFIGIAIRLA